MDTQKSIAAPGRGAPPDAVVDAELIRKYGGNGPRYTSYPTADRFVEAFDAAACAHWLGQRNVGGISRPLGLYVHVPFCDTLCFYCACNKIATRDKARARKYVDYLLKEAELVAGTLEGRRRLSKMHWGGGTPTFLPEEDTVRLVEGLRRHFDFDPSGEFAIEIDPRRAGPDRIELLARLGFNRISIGVQDFDPAVQKAVNRIQSLEETRAVIEAARHHGMRSINMDLIFGLPKQTTQGFAATLERTIELSPDRIALYSYAHLPSVFAPQRRINEADLPSGEAKLALMTQAMERLGEAGYIHIGMDHFAKPADELAIALREGRLTRDFQGYSAGGDCDLVALGVSAIGKVGASYFQNVKDLGGYYAKLDAGELPVMRGIELTGDDLVRRAVIQSLACQFELSKEAIELAYLVDFDRYFAAEMKELRQLESDGMVEIDREWITVTPRGRLLVRAVCMVFDKYLRAARQRAQYSRVM
ncbi:MAG TPA: oxygen-independent coproporphyrinogen III oxidase [Usitatibacter sp.]|nr:oxygen-independent coproporphyrinogen III oxidase [Usitatibacter sp.]